MTSLRAVVHRLVLIRTVSPSTYHYANYMQKLRFRGISSNFHEVWNGLKLADRCVLHGQFASFGTSAVFRRKHEYPPLKEEELEEDFVQGSGPGGQSVNRTMNCVVLKHLPTGVVVKCHESRSLDTNRRRARERLQERLDFHYHGENSYLNQKKRQDSEKRKEKKRRTNLRLEKKRAFKEARSL